MYHSEDLCDASTWRDIYEERVARKGSRRVHTEIFSRFNHITNNPFCRKPSVDSPTNALRVRFCWIYSFAGAILPFLYYIRDHEFERSSVLTDKRGNLPHINVDTGEIRSCLYRTRDAELIRHPGRKRAPLPLAICAFGVRAQQRSSVHGCTCRSAHGRVDEPCMLV